MGWFFITVACLAGLGLLRVSKASAQSRKYLDASSDEAPLQVDHLTPQMRRFTADTRLLRISLESSVRTIGQLIDGDFEATNDDRDGFDQMLMGATRDVVDWLRIVETLGETERGQIMDGGGNPGAIREALVNEGWAFERRNLTTAGRPPMNLRLAAILAELHQIEVALQRTSRIYR
ncbi:MAG: hypothetical protein JKY37_00780 [Nannocystaceae bacterium]|nr:hypothetical protein [Nannocystaceae bacterium]